MRLRSSAMSLNKLAMTQVSEIYEAIEDAERLLFSVNAMPSNAFYNCSIRIMDLPVESATHCDLRDFRLRLLSFCAVKKEIEEARERILILELLLAEDSGED